MSREFGGGEDPRFLAELSSPWTEWIGGISNELILPRRTNGPLVSAPYGAYRAPRARKEGPKDRTLTASGPSMTIAGDPPSECSRDGGEDRAHSIVLEQPEELLKDGGDP